MTVKYSHSKQQCLDELKKLDVLIWTNVPILMPNVKPVLTVSAAWWEWWVRNKWFCPIPPRREHQQWRREHYHLEENCVNTEMFLFLAAILLWMNSSLMCQEPDTNLVFVCCYWQTSGWQGVSVSAFLTAFCPFDCLWNVFMSVSMMCVFSVAMTDSTLKGTEVVSCFPVSTMVDSA